VRRRSAQSKHAAHASTGDPTTRIATQYSEKLQRSGSESRIDQPGRQVLGRALSRADRRTDTTDSRTPFRTTSNSDRDLPTENRCVSERQDQAASTRARRNDDSPWRCIRVIRKDSFGWAVYAISWPRGKRKVVQSPTRFVLHRLWIDAACRQEALSRRRASRPCDSFITAGSPTDR
jgi:hypothetical protein